MTEKHKSKYWAVTDNGEVMRTGTFNECWQHLIEYAGDMKVSEMVAKNIRINRIK